MLTMGQVRPKTLELGMNQLPEIRERSGVAQPEISLFLDRTYFSSIWGIQSTDIENYFNHYLLNLYPDFTIITILTTSQSPSINCTTKNAFVLEKNNESIAVAVIQQVESEVVRIKTQPDLILSQNLQQDPDVSTLLKKSVLLERQLEQFNNINRHILRDGEFLTCYGLDARPAQRIYLLTHNLKEIASFDMQVDMNRLKLIVEKLDQVVHSAEKVTRSLYGQATLNLALNAEPTITLPKSSREVVMHFRKLITELNATFAQDQKAFIAKSETAVVNRFMHGYTQSAVLFIEGLKNYCYDENEPN